MGVNITRHPFGRRENSRQACNPNPSDTQGSQEISSAKGIIEVEKHRMFKPTHRYGVALFIVRIAGGEDMEFTIREHIKRCITDWDKQVKWDYYVEFHR